jgi:hypothetical protein
MDAGKLQEHMEVLGTRHCWSLALVGISGLVSNDIFPGCFHDEVLAGDDVIGHSPRTHSKQGTPRSVRRDGDLASCQINVDQLCDLHRGGPRTPCSNSISE